MAAAAQVFNTTELLEHILLCLPLQDLLVAQHTSRYSQNVVANSTKLQRALWLVPEYTELVKYQLCTRNVTVEEMEILSGLPMPRENALKKLERSGGRYRARTWVSDETSSTRTPIRAMVQNPLLGRIFKPGSGKSYVNRSEIGDSSVSWRAMFATSPAMSEVAINTVHRGLVETIMVESSTGVTIGHMIDAVLSHPSCLAMEPIALNCVGEAF